jgi:anti-sigma B factor antagonist
MTATRSRAPSKLAPPPGELCINVLRHGDVCVVMVAGELDMATAPQLKKTLETAWRHDGAIRALVVNVRDVTFCDARGLAPLFLTYAAAGRAGVEFCLAGCQPYLLRLLNILDEAGEIPRFPGLRPALAQLAQSSSDESTEPVRINVPLD